MSQCWLMILNGNTYSYIFMFPCVNTKRTGYPMLKYLTMLQNWCVDVTLCKVFVVFSLKRFTDCLLKCILIFQDCDRGKCAHVASRLPITTNSLFDYFTMFIYMTPYFKCSRGPFSKRKVHAFTFIISSLRVREMVHHKISKCRWET